MGIPKILNEKIDFEYINNLPEIKKIEIDKLHFSNEEQ